MKFKHFPVGFWNYVKLGTLNDAQAASDWAELGMNLAFTFDYIHDEHKKEDMIAHINAMKKENIQAIVCDDRVHYNVLIEKGEDVYTENVKNSVADFGALKNVWGFHLGDEPNKEQIDGMIRAHKIFKSVCKKKVGFVNFYPVWEYNYKDLMGVDCCAFPAFLDRVVKESGLEVLAYDCYSQMTSHNSHAEICNYFKNLNVYKKVADKNKIPLIPSVLSVGHWMFRVPNEDDIRWQISTAIAHGANGLLWFYVYQRELDSNYRLSPIDLFWKRTQTFDSLARQNNILSKFYAEKLTQLKLDKVYHFLIQYGDTPAFYRHSDKFVDYVESLYNQPLIISRFIDQKTSKPVYIIVNNSQTEITRADIYFKEPFSSKNCKEWLAPGQMIIIELDCE